jgi:hypothetical protein
MEEPENITSTPLEEIALLPPTPGQLLFILITPPNSINNLAIPVLDLAYASMSGLELQPCDPTMHPSRQARSEVFLAVLLVRQPEEVNICLQLQICPVSPELHRRHLHTRRHVAGDEDHLCDVKVKAKNLVAQFIPLPPKMSIWDSHTSQRGFSRFDPFQKFEKLLSGIVAPKWPRRLRLFRCIGAGRRY